MCVAGRCGGRPCARRECERAREAGGLREASGTRGRTRQAAGAQSCLLAGPRPWRGGSQGRRSGGRGPGLPRHLGSGPARAAAAGAALAAARGKRTGAPAQRGGRRGARLRCAGRGARAGAGPPGPGRRGARARRRTSAADRVPASAARPGRPLRSGLPAPASGLRGPAPPPPAPGRAAPPSGRGCQRSARDS